VDLIAALRSFLRVAETGSFSAAAAEWGITQPAISRQVSALEEHFGTRLGVFPSMSSTLRGAICRRAPASSSNF
jgi:hypothetical protein